MAAIFSPNKKFYKWNN